MQGEDKDHLVEQEQHSLWVELLILWKYRIWILGLTLAGMIGAYIYTMPLVYPPEYLSVSSFVPPSLEDVKSLNFHKLRYEGFGAAEDEDLERLSSTLESDSAFWWMVERFKLVAHYELNDVEDPSQQEKKLRNKYRKRVSIGVSAQSTVEIKVHDTDPQMAADMANALLDYADRFVERVAARKAGIRELELSLEQLQNTSDSLYDSLGYYREKYQIYHFEELSEAIAARIANSTFNQPEFHRNYDKVRSIEFRLEYLEEHIADIINELAFRRENLKTYPSLINITGRAVPSHVKARPRRTLVILLTGVLIFGVSCILSIFIHKEWQRR